MSSGKKQERDWLILAHCFNMDGRAASQTITDRLPYLMEQGVKPVVISAPIGCKDDAFPHYRVLSLAPSGILFEVRHLISQRVKSRIVRQTLKALLTLALLPFYLLEKIFIHLDSQWSWFLGAVIVGAFTIKKHNVRLIYSTAGPSSTHWAGFVLAKIYKIPWLAEIHDPLLYDDTPRHGQRYHWQNKLEELISRHADAVIYFTNTALARAGARHPFRGISTVLRPGASPPDFVKVEYSRGSRIHFGHFGSLGAGRNLCPMIRVFAAIKEQSPELAEKMVLDIYGMALDDSSGECLKQYSIDGMIREHGRLEYDPVNDKSGRIQVVEEMQRTDILLLVHGKGNVCEEYIPSKVYEYLLSGRPILGLVTPDTELADMLLTQGHLVVDGDDDEAIKSAVVSLMTTFMDEGLLSSNSRSPYTVENAVEKILGIEQKINQVCRP